MSLPRFQFTGNDGKQVAGEVLLHDARHLRLRVDTVAGNRLRKPFEEHGPADELPKGWMMETLTRAPVDAYQRILDRKRQFAVMAGFTVAEDDLPAMLFPFQRKAVAWALQRGKAALFLDTGLGKTLCELTWAHFVSEYTGKPVLIFTPLAVAEQCVREGLKFGIPVTRCKSQSDVRPGVNVTNYQRLHLFDPSVFGGLVLDESSVLKGDGPTRKGIVAFTAGIDYRLAATATPAPNELTELVNHADYLGIMEPKEVLATYFRQGEEKGTPSIHKWHLKGHAKEAFWKWVASWAVAARKPSDWGFSDAGYDLPPIEIHEHIVEASLTSAASEGLLFDAEARGIKAQRRVRRDTLDERVRVAAELANEYADEPLIVWAELNPESEALRKSISDAVEITGALSDEQKETRLLEFLEGRKRVLISKPSISGHGLNLQFCARQIWCGIGNSHEQRYQGIRRSHRFGQQRPVQVHLVRSDADGPIARNLLRKELQSGELMDELVRAVQRDGMIMARTGRDEMDYQPQAKMSLPHWLKGHR